MSPLVARCDQALVAALVWLVWLADVTSARRNGFYKSYQARRKTLVLSWQGPGLDGQLDLFPVTVSALFKRRGAF
ncbi:hypothetical protein NDU88_007120 [Pleurodeles waltl]|uniref:Secreted protein n=1 Tax=Pleurodeles waltl TaxID=8319 RepID=A0AAV7US11_PLEWA|nr:hypothetical protein NDU88_007120 [Pleurodeles waltl]